MRHTELQQRLEDALGAAHVRSWTTSQVLPELDNRTVQEALDAGVGAKQVWAAVHHRLGLPASER